jgi:hypothetical protein
MTLAALGLTLASFASAEGEKKEVAVAVDVVAHATEGGWQFLGVDGCKICHKSEKSGNQHGLWMESKHAKAFEVLGTEEAKTVAVAAGVEGNPQEADACLQCHVTGHGAKAEMFGPKYTKEEGVGCESCHGAGSGYKAKKTMEDRTASIAAGLIMPTEAQCQTCHNEKSPTFKEFKYAEMVKTIAHPTPKSE